MLPHESLAANRNLRTLCIKFATAIQDCLHRRFNAHKTFNIFRSSELSNVNFHYLGFSALLKYFFPQTDDLQHHEINAAKNNLSQICKNRQTFVMVKSPNMK